MGNMRPCCRVVSERILFVVCLDVVLSLFRILACSEVDLFGCCAGCLCASLDACRLSVDAVLGN